MKMPLWKICASFTLLGFIHLLCGKGILVPEKALQSAIAKTLGISEKALSQEIVASELVRLEVNGKEIRDLSGLQFAKNLEYLVLRDNLITDLSPIEGLKNLQKLDLSGNKISNLDTLVPLSGFHSRQRIDNLKLKLQVPNLSENEKADLVLQISQAREQINQGPCNLRVLNLSDNLLLGLSGIEHFTNLVHLDVSNNNLTDLQGLNKLKGLVRFIAYDNQLGRVEPYDDQNRNKQYDPGEPFTDISGNGIRDTDPLSEFVGLTSLNDLHLYNNRLRSLQSLRDLPNLRTLLLSGNLIDEISPLGALEQLEQLSLANNQICQLDGLEKLSNLRRLNLDENHICDLRPLRELRFLHSLNIHSNLITDLTNLEGLKGLVRLGISRNYIDDFSALLQLPKLTNVLLSQNYLPTDEKATRENLALAQNRGVYLSISNQKKRTAQPFALIDSLVGHPQSNKHLADFLRGKGFARLNDFISSQRFNDSVMEDIMTRWEITLKRGGEVANLYYPE